MKASWDIGKVVVFLRYSVHGHSITENEPMHTQKVDVGIF